MFQDIPGISTLLCIQHPSGFGSFVFSLRCPLVKMAFHLLLLHLHLSHQEGRRESDSFILKQDQKLHISLLLINYEPWPSHLTTHWLQWKLESVGVCWIKQWSLSILKSLPLPVFRVDNLHTVLKAYNPFKTQKCIGIRKNINCQNASQNTNKM